MRRAQKHGMMATVTVTGRIIVAQRDCRKCAQELPDDSRFCSYCGTSILEAAPVLEAAHVPTPEAEVPEDPLQQIVQAYSVDVPPQPRSATSTGFGAAIGWVVGGCSVLLALTVLMFGGCATLLSG
jgi:hypothetical protein